MLFIHLGHAHDDRHEGPDDGDEAGQDQCLAAVLFEERVGVLHVLALEEPRVGLVEDGGPGLGPDEVARLVADDGRNDDQQGKQPHVELDGVRGHQQAGGEQHGIAGQEEAHQQAGFREDDAAHQQDHPGRQGGIGQEDLGVQPVGQEGGQLRLDRSCTAQHGHSKVIHQQESSPSQGYLTECLR